MNSNLRKIIQVVLIAVIIFAGINTPAQAMWHVFLDEHFNKDQQNPNLQWPWITDLRNGLRWHWNPLPNHFRWEDNRTDFCWGLQDWLYNSRVTPRVEIKQSIWCAYTNRGDVDNPRWPEDDDYEHRQNAWVWWGPVDLTDAVSAAVSYWMYLDLEYGAGDSLSCVAVNNPNLLTLEGDDFFENVAIGKSYSHRINRDWVWQAFYLDSLTIGGDEDSLYSYLGEEEVYIAFVWHSNRYAIAGKGAFIDDVMFSWDDGLFDLYPVESLLGYAVNEDSTDWNDNWPDEDDEISFRLDFKVIGIGETPEFNVDCYLDDELVYRETMRALASDTTVFTVTADTLWTVTSDSHAVRWEIDTPIDDFGSVEEGNELNNVRNFPFVVTYNPPPVFALEMPADSIIGLTGADNFQINWTLSDTLLDEEFRVFLFWTTDTSGIAENAELPWNEREVFLYVGRDFDAEIGEGHYIWEAEGQYGYKESLPDSIPFQIVGLCTDNWPGNTVSDVADGWWAYYPPNEIRKIDPLQPDKFGISNAFPNPFNDAININYSIQHNENVTLNVYDLSGRNVASILNQWQTTGSYTKSWKPNNLSGGIYLLRLETANQIDFQKVVYLP